MFIASPMTHDQINDDLPTAPMEHAQPGPPCLMFEKPGDTIGPFTLVKLIGEGGFGTVYLAQRRSPMVQQVALKVIKPGMDTRAVVARFDQERQALAIMEHPGIAKVFDAGTTPAGRPYFAMEFVPGEPITDYCDRQTLGTRERLALFVEVCDAVEHAHRRGIIHRDLKPSNVLVTCAEGTAQVKVIDFGIAKAIGHDLSAKTLFTEAGQFIGTPEYMSPEQADSRKSDIDTRTDVYSLGVMLYELLVGTLPFDATSLRSAGYAEIQRILRDVDPPKPSTKLSEIGDAANDLARKRHTNAAALRKILHNELEWIPLKAMRKDREQRYHSPSDLADDVRNYLDGLPLRAGPESAWYRFGKLARRRRATFVAVGVTFLGAAAGLAGLGVGYIRASQSAILERAAREEAIAQKSRAEAITRFVLTTISAIDPEVTKGRDPTIKEMLDHAAAGIKSELGGNGGDPQAEASLRSTLGQAYFKLGRFQESIRELSRARDIDRLVLGAEHIQTLTDEHHVGACLLELRDVVNARVALERAYTGRTEALGPFAADTLESLGLLGFAAQLSGDDQDALNIYRRVFEAQVKSLPGGEMSRGALETQSSIADVLQSLGKLEDAEREARRLRELAIRAHGQGGLMAMRAGSILASILKDLSKFDESERIAREVLASKRAMFGPEHAESLLTESTLAHTLYEQRKYEEAEPLAAHAATTAERTLGSSHDATLSYKGIWARISQQLGRLDDAERLLRDVLEARRKVQGPDAVSTLAEMNNLGLLLLDRKKPAEAEIVFREMLTGVDRVMGEDHWIRGQARINVGECLFDLGKFEEAETFMLAGQAWLARTLPKGNSRLAGAAVSLAKLYNAWGKPERAAKWIPN